METVDRIVSTYGTRNPYELASALDIIVITEHLGNINGYYNQVYGQKFIHINENISEHIQLFTCAHEIGHAILHTNLSTPFLRNKTFLSIDKMEKEANQFAIHLIISNESLSEYRHLTISQLSRLYGYKEELIKIRLDMH